MSQTPSGPTIDAQKACPQCMSLVHVDAARCPHCTSWISRPVLSSGWVWIAIAIAAVVLLAASDVLAIPVNIVEVGVDNGF